MCGIAGVIGAACAPDAVEAVVGRLQTALRHRGPDGAGSYRDLSSGLALVQTRLAIQDPTPTPLPLGSPDGRYVLLLNGEIYNFHALRERLLAKGFSFQTNGDTEVVLAWLSLFGRDGLADLRGMFALAFWDGRARRLLLARDSFGIKPLYLAEKSKRLVFASEVRALLATGLIPAELDPVGLDGFLATGSVPEPGTLVRGVRALPPGGWLEWQDERVRTGSFDRLDFSAPAREGREAAPQISEALSDSLRHHFISDVPVGLALSGGLDSGALLVRAAQLGLPVQSFSIRLDGSPHDEAQAAAELAGRLGVTHAELTLTDELARHWIEPFLAAIDQPTIDGFNTYVVAKLAADHGLKVLLTGIGGDEWLGGYPSFRRVPRLRRWGQLARPATRFFSSPAVGPFGARAARLGDFFAGSPTLARSYQAVRGLFATAERRMILKAYGLPPGGFDPAEADPGARTAEDPRLGVSRLETTRYLRHQLLRDADVFGLAHGVEIRVPFVDRPFFHTVQSTLLDLRFQPGKKLLRDAVPELPTGFARRPKQGFALPFRRWLDGPLWADLAPPGDKWPGLDLRPWARAWSLLVLRDFAGRHGLDLPVL